VELGQHPIAKTDTITIMERIGHFLDDEVEECYLKLKREGISKREASSLIMEQLDSINVLYSVSLFEPAQIILRSLIENIVGLEFILKEDTKKRAAAYYL